MNKYLVMEFIGKLMIFGGILYSIFKVSPVAGCVAIVGYGLYNLAFYLSFREQQKQAQEFVTKMIDKYQDGLKGGSC